MAGGALSLRWHESPGRDCSGFVQLTFLQRLGVSLPRTTGELLETGHPVARDQLRPGDLLFFRTGRSRRHVGIYMGEGQFVHASSSAGVRQSSLHNRYWRRHYWKARRVSLELPVSEVVSGAGS
ncbi:MAG: NlpC/P60 family protein [Alcanivorax sp.]|nr:NlpC/P60 family protein [Alcanivorax sp.]